ncbi:hypothetical protein Tco_0987861 [Tanacetum coccineum]
MCEEFRERQQAANIDQSPPRKMSLQEMEDLKQHYLDEILSLSNDLQIKDYRNEKIDIRFRRECKNMIDELKVLILRNVSNLFAMMTMKSSVDDLVPIPRESELTLDSTDIECRMPINPPLPLC